MLKEKPFAGAFGKKNCDPICRCPVVGHFDRKVFHLKGCLEYPLQVLVRDRSSLVRVFRLHHRCHDHQVCQQRLARTFLHHRPRRSTELPQGLRQKYPQHLLQLPRRSAPRASRMRRTSSVELTGGYLQCPLRISRNGV